MKKLIGCFVALCSLYVMAATNDLSAVGSTLRLMHEEYGQRFPRESMIKEDWEETRLVTNLYFRQLRQIVTNQWADVLFNLSSITNQGDRLIVISAGTAENEYDYLNRINTMADMVLSNKVSSFELVYFGNRCSVANHYAESVFLRRYNENAISNLIMKVNSAGGFPSGVDSIFTGEEKQLYEEAVEEGMVGP